MAYKKIDRYFSFADIATESEIGAILQRSQPCGAYVALWCPMEKKKQGHTKRKRQPLGGTDIVVQTNMFNPIFGFFPTAG